MYYVNCVCIRHFANFAMVAGLYYHVTCSLLKCNQHIAVFQIFVWTDTNCVFQWFSNQIKLDSLVYPSYLLPLAQIYINNLKYCFKKWSLWLLSLLKMSKKGKNKWRKATQNNMVITDVLWLWSSLLEYVQADISF